MQHKPRPPVAPHARVNQPNPHGSHRQITMNSPTYCSERSTRKLSAQSPAPFRHLRPFFFFFFSFFSFSTLVPAEALRRCRNKLV